MSQNKLTGIVKEVLSDGRYRVVLDIEHDCKGCEMASMCGQNGCEKIMHSDIEVHVGDRVRFAIEPSVRLKAEFLVYGLPVLALVGGAGLAINLFHSVLLQVLCAFAGFTLACLFVWAVTRSKQHEFMAKITKIL